MCNVLRPLQAIILEDEPLASAYLQKLLEETGRIRVVAKASMASEVRQLVVHWKPDVCFIDLRVPEGDGFETAKELSLLKRAPLIVFVTGYSDRAVDAFTIEAVDYLLKPLTRERVLQAVQRIENRLMGTTSFPLRKDLSALHLVVKDLRTDEMLLIERDEIVAAIRKGRRTFIHTASRSYATYYTIQSIEEWLGGEPFLRVSRSAIVNLSKVETIVHYGDRLYQIHLRDRFRTKVTASRSGAVRLAAYLRQRTPHISV